MSEIRLSEKEAKVLDLLERSPGRVSRGNSCSKPFGGYNEGVKTRTLDVHISRLRSKLTANLGKRIHAISGQGYLLEHCGQPTEVDPKEGSLSVQREVAASAPQLNHSNSCWSRAA
jgi:DNA-binding winged helix-turn-helix (wHTH) protein